MPVYPNLPAAYLYDLARDGSVMTHQSGTTTNYTYTAADVDAAASWSSLDKGTTATETTSGRFLVLFPSPRQVAAVLFACRCISTNGGSTLTIQTSVDTTNGSDGTWVSAGTHSVGGRNYSLSMHQLRSASLYTVNLSNIKGVRAQITSAGSNYGLVLQAFAIWGTTQPTGLVMWHPTLDQPLLNSDGSLDRGDIASNTAVTTQQFRIKNTSSQTANNVAVQMDTTGNQTTLDTDTTFSLDDSTYSATRTITSIAAGATSAVVYMKRGTPTEATGAVRVAALRAVVGSWT